MAVTSKGLDVEATHTLLGEATVRCDVRFRNGPEIGRTRKLTIDPGETGTARFMPSRLVVRLRIGVDCRPAKEDEDSR